MKAKPMLTKILIGGGGLVVLLLVVIAAQPSAFRITRSLAIGAPPDAVFAQINDLHRWGAWDPWAKLDPNCKTTFTGPDAGVGAAMAWDGNNQVGAGQMTITDSKPGELVQLRLEFQRPMKATNLAEFTLKPDGGKTTVTWTMSGENNFMGKAFSLFVNCDKMVGGQFEQGLANLKTVAEATVAK
ncbi:MAG: hypothetical protein RLZZ350_2410 [Verrucomicrobiota bacterium]|jgi:uncharacterized protein YndB with AHSA1/START domain